MSSCVILAVASSGTRKYLMFVPRTYTSAIRQNRSPSRLVQMTSRKWMFIQLRGMWMGGHRAAGRTQQAPAASRHLLGA